MDRVKPQARVAALKPRDKPTRCGACGHKALLGVYDGRGTLDSAYCLVHRFAAWRAAVELTEA